MRKLPILVVVLPLLVTATGCAETVRCPDGEFFGGSGACVPIPDAGQASPDTGQAPLDAGTIDGSSEN